MMAPDLGLAQLSSSYTHCGLGHGDVGSTPATHVAPWQVVEAARPEEVDESGPPVAPTLAKISRQPPASRVVVQLAIVVLAAQV
eukprot:COSAG06_NODE_45414_length_355_cov_0.609375_1_plen_83_part_01